MKQLVSESAWQHLLGCARPAIFDPGAVVVEDGGPPGKMLMIEDGSVLVQLMVHGTGRYLARCGPGDVVGELSLVDGGSRVARVVAEDRVVGGMVGREHLDQLSSQRPDLALEIWAALARILSGRLRSSNEFRRAVGEAWLTASEKSRAPRAVARSAPSRAVPSDAGAIDLDAISSRPELGVDVLDPLGLDEVFRGLPALNAAADTRPILRVLEGCASADLVERAARMNLPEALATVRDVGMLAASLRRHGTQVADVLPRVEQVLLLLGERTGMVPRDTVFHYGPWNPRGARERTFTGDPNERHLIESTRIASARLEDAVARCHFLCEGDPEDEAFEDEAVDCAEDLRGLIEAIEHAYQNVDPLFFARTLRPYFDPIRIGGSTYAGAAAAPLSVGMIDHLLWSSDEEDPTYRSFQEHTILYNTPLMKRMYAERLQCPSILTRTAAHPIADLKAYSASVKALDDVILRLLRFRGRHMALATAAYDPSIRAYSTGSAGYGNDTLMLILRLTKASRRKLHLHMLEG